MDRLLYKVTRSRDNLARNKDTETPETIDLGTVQDALDTLTVQKKEYESMSLQLMDVESNPTALEEDALKSDEFDGVMVRALRDSKYMISQRTIFSSISSLEAAMRGLTTAYETSPGNDHSIVTHRVNSKVKELEQQLHHSRMPEEEELRGRGNLALERAYELQSRVAGVKATDTKPAVTKATKSNVKLRHIEIPNFSGKTEDWLGFRRLFNKAVHMNDDLDDDTRLTYLVQAMQDPRVKARIAERLDEPGAYTKIMNELESEHDKPRWMHRRYTDQLQHLATSVHTRDGLKQFTNTLTIILNGFRRLNGGDIGMILTSAAEGAMDAELRHLWNQRTDSKRVTPQVEDLIQFINDQADQLEDGPINKGEKVRQRQLPKQRGVTNSVTSGTQQSQTTQQPQNRGSKPRTNQSTSYERPHYSTQSCMVCQGSHPIFYCPTFEGLTIPLRKEKVVALKLCLNCLKPHHMARECNSTFRCRVQGCGKKHNSLLHEERNGPPPTAVHQTNSATHKEPEEKDEECLLMTAQATLMGPTGKVITVRALLDAGSTLSIISKQLVKQLQLTQTGRRVSISGIKTKNSNQEHHMARVTLASEYQPGWRREITVAQMDEVIRRLPLQTAHAVRTLPHLKHITLADDRFDQPGRIDLLLGQDVFRHLFLDGKLKGARPEDPEAWQTVFGWTVMGTYNPHSQASTQQAITHVVASIEANKESDAILARFQELEEPASFTVPLTPTEERVEQHYSSTHNYNKETQRCTVRLPKIEDPPKLGESKTQAYNRAKANEISLIKKGRYDSFQKVILEYLTLGHAIDVTGQQPHSQIQSSQDPHDGKYYMPVHSVIKESSSTTKVRAVFDASARTTNHISLNETLAVGPTLHPTIDKILLQFRQYKVAITSDISKMYREVLLHPNDQPLHRFIWRPTTTSEWKEFQMTRVTFGVAASPYLAVKTLQQTGLDHGEQHPKAQWHINHSFYVDDLLGGAHSEEEATSLYQQLSHILQQANFHLRKWRSSSPAVLQAIPKELQETVPTQELVDQHAATYPKALGISWDSQQDSIFTSINLPTTFRATKRGVISDIARTFDVLGWISPVILPMKLLYRDLWKEQTSWDEPISSEQAQRHQDWREELPLLQEIQLPRCYYASEDPLSIQLHGFSDASREAYGAVIYVRATYPTMQPTVELVISKSKVAPLATRTIPQLELCGANLLVKLMTTTSQTLQVPKENIWTYTDSTVVLGWLSGESGRYCIFSGHRITSTTILLPYKHWRHVPTGENPADAASRGMSASQLKEDPLWWHGPAWLSTDPVTLPRQPTDEHLAAQREVERKPAPHTVMSAMEDTYYEQQQTSYSKLLRMTCWMQRAVRVMKKESQEVSSYLSTAEGQTATKLLLQRSQARGFQKEIRAITSQHDLSPSSSILSLHPIMGKDKLLRVGGRLWQSHYVYHIKHPVILSAKDHLVFLLLRHYHLLLGHCGPSTLLTHAANLYHVVGGRRLSRSVCTSCITCRKQAAKASSQLLGQLPPASVEPNQVFLHTGMDCCGPFKIRQGYTRKPVEVTAYLAIFICFATKAVHLEVVSDLKTPSFLAALDRFVARRGLPLHLHSDNGSNYKGAQNQLVEFYKMLSSKQGQDAIQAYVFQHHITWHNSPQRAPHFGGLWEAAVKSTKFHLKRIIGHERLTFEELTTITCNVESFLNSRPLGPVTSHDLDGLSPLTPSHFLIGRAARAYPQAEAGKQPTVLQRWNICKKASQDFWDRWSREYLQHLQKATKWHKVNRNFSVGDLVMLTDGQQFKCQWSMAKIIKVYPGSDGYVRAVDVQLEHVILPTSYTNKDQLAKKIKTTTSILRRPVTKLALLLAKDEVPGDRVNLNDPVPPPSESMKPSDCAVFHGGSMSGHRPASS